MKWRCHLCEFTSEIPMIDSPDKKQLVLSKPQEEHFYTHGAKNFEEVTQMAFDNLRKSKSQLIKVA